MTEDDMDRRLTREAAAWNDSPNLPAVSLTAAVQRVSAEPTARRKLIRSRWRPGLGGRRWRGVAVGNAAVAGGVLVLIAALAIPFALTRGRGGSEHRAVAGPAATAAASRAAQIPAVPSALVCPGDYAGSTIPAKTTIPDGKDRLMPQRAPLSALVCAYRSTSGSTLGLAVPVIKNLADVSMLSWLPRLLPDQSVPCGGVGFDGPYSSLLLGVRYANGVVWVNGSANTTDCTESTNGAFKSLGNASEGIIALAKANGNTIPTLGAVLPTGPDDPCQPGQAIGRYGQETTMVPAGANRVTVCQILTSHNVDSYRHVTSTSLGELAAVLNSATTTTSTSSTTCTGGAPIASYEARFDYPDGPAVLVRIDLGCAPSVDNSSLQATNGVAAANVAEQMLAGH